MDSQFHSIKSHNISVNNANAIESFRISRVSDKMDPNKWGFVLSLSTERFKKIQIYLYECTGCRIFYKK